MNEDRRQQLQARMKAAGYEWFRWGEGKGFLVKLWDKDQGGVIAAWNDEATSKILASYLDNGEGSPETIIAYLLKTQEDHQARY